MRTTPPGVFTSVTAAAALLVLLLLGATGPGSSSAASSESGLTSDNFEKNCGAPSRYATITGGNTVWVTTNATPALMINASYSNVLLRDFQDRAIYSLGDYLLSVDFQASSVGQPTTNPDGSTTTPTIISVTRSGTAAAHASSTTSYHDSFAGGGHEDTGNESRWRRFRQDEPFRLPDQFMARFLNTLIYLAEVITADVISALLFGRWRPRYYQRARRNRLNWRRRRRFRRFRMNAADVVRRIWDACFRLHEAMCLGQDNVSGPTYQMISNIQLTEYPATLSTFADVPTSEIIATVASARCSAFVSIASISSPTSTFADLPFPASRGALPEATTLNLRPPVPPRQLLLLEASEMSAVASCYPRVSLPDAELEITLRPAVSPRSPLLLAAAPPPTGPPALAPSQCLPEAADEVMTLRAKRSPKAMLPSAIAARKGCAASMTNTLVRHSTAQPSVATAVEAFDGQADTADEPLPPPFFVSEHYTPDSTCYVSAHGVAYTTIIMSYSHQFNHPTRGDTQEDTPITTQTGDVSDILWPASNARMRCKWSQACVQTTSSEYYRCSVEAVFASRFIPDDADMAVLSDLVRSHL